MEALLMMMAAGAVAIPWIIYQQRRLAMTRRRLAKAEQRLDSAKLTLTAAKEQNEELINESMFHRAILMDVAKGEADVWIENGVIRAQRRTTGTPPLH